YLRLVEEFCEVSTMEKQFLLSPEAPIVLLRKKEAAASKLANSIAPDNPTLGVMMPSNPLHHIMMRELGFPLVATSGNLTDEPICIDEKEAQVRLRAIADFFLMHNRPIVRHVDDSVLRVVLGRELMLRRARGYAPLPITVKENLPAILSVGGHLKNTIAVSKDRNVFLSQHIGDLETSEAYHAFEEVARSLRNMYDIVPGMVVSDRHPNYISTQYAEKLGIPHVSVQHHHAHIAACLAEHQLDGPVLGVSWDGTGYGDDQTIWGGEFIHAKKKEYKRFAYFRPFPLPSGDRAVKEPRRTALGLLYAMLSEEEFLDADWLPFQSFERNDLILIKRMLIQNINCPLVCSVGRLFDAVASLIGLRHQVSFEGQAAIALEHSIRGNERGHYPYTFHKTETMHMIDWEPMIREILSDWEKQVSPPAIAAKFHNTLVEIIVSVAKKCKENTISLSGGCFQNTYLLEQSVTRLKQEGFQVVWHRRIPPNDGGIALGQLIAAFHREKT
ncbi:carbamoyltransferase HypF, partial [bacterium]|nr:carbamoyltransferase HypF [bacterium]